MTTPTRYRPRHRRPTNLTLLVLQITWMAAFVAAALWVGVLWVR